MKPRVAAALLSVVLLAVLLLTACSTGPEVIDQRADTGKSSEASTPPDASQGQITIKDDGFSPESVTVKPGTRVVWFNGTQEPRGIAIEGGPSSGAIKPGGVASHVFGKAGTYKYADSKNASVKGVVIVK